MGPNDYYVYSNSLVDHVEELNKIPHQDRRHTLGHGGRRRARPKDANQIQYNIVRIDGQKSVYIPIMKQGGDTNTIAGGERCPRR